MTDAIAPAGVPLDLAAIKARRARLSVAPWRTEPDGSLAKVVFDLPDGHELVADTLLPHEAEFVAHAWADVPALVTEVERLRAEAAQLRAAAKRMLDASNAGRTAIGHVLAPVLESSAGGAEAACVELEVRWVEAQPTFDERSAAADALAALLEVPC